MAVDRDRSIEKCRRRYNWRLAELYLSFSYT